jgi:hypothetical protein
LEDDTDFGAPEAGSLILAKAREITARYNDTATGCPLKSCQNHHQRRLAGARGTDNRYGLAQREIQRNAAKDFDRTGATVQTETNVVQ